MVLVLVMMQVTVGPEGEAVYGGFFGWNRVIRAANTS